MSKLLANETYKTLKNFDVDRDLAHMEWVPIFDEYAQEIALLEEERAARKLRLSTPQ